MTSRDVTSTNSSKEGRASQPNLNLDKTGVTQMKSTFQDPDDRDKVESTIFYPDIEGPGNNTMKKRRQGRLIHSDHQVPGPSAHSPTIQSHSKEGALNAKMWVGYFAYFLILSLSVYGYH